MGFPISERDAETPSADRASARRRHATADIARAGSASQSRRSSLHCRRSLCRRDCRRKPWSPRSMFQSGRPRSEWLTCDANIAGDRVQAERHGVGAAAASGLGVLHRRGLKIARGEHADGHARRRVREKSVPLSRGVPVGTTANARIEPVGIGPIVDGVATAVEGDTPPMVPVTLCAEVVPLEFPLIAATMVRFGQTGPIARPGNEQLVPQDRLSVFVSNVTVQWRRRRWQRRDTRQRADLSAARKLAPSVERHHSQGCLGNLGTDIASTTPIDAAPHSHIKAPLILFSHRGTHLQQSRGEYY